MSTATDKTRPKISAWPRLTAKQRELVRKFDKSQYGDLHCDGRLRVTVYALIYKGIVEGGSSGWYHLSQRGKDYVRFGMRRGTR